MTLGNRAGVFPTVRRALNLKGMGVLYFSLEKNSTPMPLRHENSFQHTAF
jgi:hypothetical protein